MWTSSKCNAPQWERESTNNSSVSQGKKRVKNKIETNDISRNADNFGVEQRIQLIYVPVTIIRVWSSLHWHTASLKNYSKRFAPRNFEPKPNSVSVCQTTIATVYKRNIRHSIEFWSRHGNDIISYATMLQFVFSFDRNNLSTKLLSLLTFNFVRCNRIYAFRRRTFYIHSPHFNFSFFSPTLDESSLTAGHSGWFLVCHLIICSLLFGCKLLTNFTKQLHLFVVMLHSAISIG